MIFINKIEIISFSSPLFSYCILSNIIIFTAILILLLKDTFLLYFIALELIILAINLNFIIGSILQNDSFGIYIAILLLAVAAVDTAIGLSLLLKYYRRNGNTFNNKLLSVHLKG